MADTQFSLAAFMRLPMQQKLLSIIALSMVAAIAVAGWTWTRTPTFAVLFTNVSERDGGNIIAALQQMNTPFKFSESGGAILVPQQQVHELRMRLASQGLPKGGLVGFELMETQKLGMSQFIEQINFQRALEGELSRSIQSLAAVQGARVHLAMPKQTGFMRDEQKPSASVVLNIHPGRNLDPNQVAGIAHMVASSVPHLPAANVSVIDQSGNLLSSEKSNGRNSGLDASQLKYMQEIEASTVRRIENILAPMVGPGNFRAQVTADIDFSQAEQVAETYKPNSTPEISIRSQQVSESGGGIPAAAGVPGALSNQPPVPATAPLTSPPAPGTPGAPGATTTTVASAANAATGRRDATTNYELDKTIRHVRQPVGAIKRLSVAVVINHRKTVAQDGKASYKPLASKEMAQINDLVKEAMGYNKDRGDSLNVQNSPFATTDSEPVEETPIWKNPTLIGWVLEGLKYLIFAGLAAYLFFGVVKPFLRKLMDSASRMPVITEETAFAAPGAASYDQKVQAARDLARQEPKVVATVIKDWVGGNQPAGKVQ
ncbi:MAG: flagellar M-ring protein FliF [Rhodocyclaceae bacterium]|nr:flagellar M-ring protein FliF [Rhodocyclaceae bacterium]MBX3678356.1 flagellar M-ring protein FliF [Rhodocyclaceae bacterium]MCB1892103.1 flagellar M-ring protein FliF [Rhodocyclaceae bacterium]MCP5297423.1 flagellar M-ring protein FliF [Zoogloeaceae bacterium]MCW5596444.1 flagellar M-ring protein FliF [Rhodocyclaceae bacterium]